jgi:hypothetical protein
MEVLWIIHTDTKNEKSADSIFKQLSKKIKSPIRFEKFENYYKDQTIIIYFHSSHVLNSWEQFILSVLTDAQSFGRGWQLFGDITSQSSGLCREFNLSGIVQAEFHIEPE